jgi:BirA family biotin operon repressor/biotin-[acetyl-CoA-carboxylase] ligase
MADTLTLESLRATLGERPFRYFVQVASSQDVARSWALAEPDLPTGAVVIAGHQTAGRGRQGRPWLSEPGTSLMCSIVLRPQIKPGQLPQITMAGSLAAAETVDALLPGRVAIKWPNDILVNRRKIAGILSEATWFGERLAAVVLGIGINIRYDFGSSELDGRATSLECILGQPVDRHTLLAALLARVDHWTALLSSSTLVDTWRSWLSTLGRRVTVYLDPNQEFSESFEGLAVGTEDDGALIVRLDSGEERRVRAADVSLKENE